MNRSYPLSSNSRPIASQELARKTAVHEAGHAAAIHLGNRKKQLPPVFFQIKIKQAQSPSRTIGQHSQWLAEIDGGRLIHTLPSSIDEVAQHFSPAQKASFLQAFNADIFNLLVGPLAEANYVASRDGEIINAQLLSLDSLARYGGAMDMKIAQDYIGCLTDKVSEHQKIMLGLFIDAFHFINERPVWRAIIALSNYILTQDSSIIPYEDITAVLDANYYSARKPLGALA